MSDKTDWLTCKLLPTNREIGQTQTNKTGKKAERKEETRRLLESEAFGNKERVGGGLTAQEIANQLLCVL